MHPGTERTTRSDRPGIGVGRYALLGSMVTLVGISNYATVPLTYTAVVALLVAMSRLAR